MEQYEHGGDIYSNNGIMLDFSVNTNPFGMPESVKQAIIDHVPQYARYPDPSCGTLRRMLAARHGLDPSMVICGNGASELIFSLCSCLKPEQVLIPSPTFSEYQRGALLFGGQVLNHPLSEAAGFALMENILENLTPQTKLLFLCNPNNPTGRLIDSTLLNQVADACLKNKTLLVLDECFIDFTSGKSMLSNLEKYPNLLILQAFTKIYAMAGLRLGMLYCGDSHLLTRIARHMPTWSVSGVAQAAGIAALTEKNWLEKTQQVVKMERTFLTESLCDLGLTVYQSDANFLLTKSEIPLYPSLKASGILVRSCQNFTGLNQHYTRIGVKTREENLVLLRTLREALHD